jgi:hypothetical protein
MSEPHESYSSRKAENTRVKVKQRKKTVGITLPQNLVKRARKHNLNISRITEQALFSILDYLESSKPINMSKCESISQLPTRAGSLAWLGRSLYEAEVAGSSPARPTTHFHLTFISN